VERRFRVRDFECRRFGTAMAIESVDERDAPRGQTLTSAPQEQIGHSKMNPDGVVFARFCCFF